MNRENFSRRYILWHGCWHREIQDAIDNARDALQGFSKEVVADMLVQSKMNDGKKQCDDMIRRVEGIRAELEEKLRA